MCVLFAWHWAVLFRNAWTMETLTHAQIHWLLLLLHTKLRRVKTRASVLKQWIFCIFRHLKIQIIKLAINWCWVFISIFHSIPIQFSLWPFPITHATIIFVVTNGFHKAGVIYCCCWSFRLQKWCEMNNNSR